MSRLEIKGLGWADFTPFGLTLDGADCVVLSGPSGCGKTRLLRAIADLDDHKGHVFLDGIDCSQTSPPKWRRRVGLLPTTSRWWRDTVGAHFAATEIDHLERLGFEQDVMKWVVSRLSSGEKQRLSVLRLLANRPRVLLLDEPTANLDPENAIRVETLLTEYKNRFSAPLLWVSHDAAQIDRVATSHYTICDDRLGLVSESRPFKRRKD